MNFFGGSALSTEARYTVEPALKPQNGSAAVSLRSPSVMA